MQIKTPAHVVAFTIAITLFATVASVVYDWTMISPGAFDRNLGWRMLFAASLGAFVAGITATRMLREHRLKLSLEYALNYDALTGAYSRSAIFRRLEEAARQPGVLVIADIDHFKKINDTWGHVAGDQVLRHFGKTTIDFLSDTFGPDRAAIGRIGGEEFLILLPQADPSGIADWIEGLRQAIREGPRLDDADSLTLTASYGVALLGKGCVDKAILEADSALYRAKESGRDRACISRMIPQPEDTDGPKRIPA